MTSDIDPGRAPTLRPMVLEDAVRHGPVAALLLALTCIPLASADEPPEAWYIQAGGGIFHQSGVKSGEWVVSETAPGGTTFGLELAAGRRLSSLLSVEIELSRTGIMEATEPSRYGMTFLEEMRDSTAGLNGRFHLRLSPVVELEPVIGVGLLRQSVWSRTEYADGSSTDREAHGAYGAPCASAGADLRVGTRRMAFVPSFRVRWAFWEHAFEGPYWYAPPAKTHLAFGLAGRISF